MEDEECFHGEARSGRASGSVCFIHIVSSSLGCNLGVFLSELAVVEAC